jgi:hypothetical protein
MSKSPLREERELWSGRKNDEYDEVVVATYDTIVGFRGSPTEMLN